MFSHCFPSAYAFRVQRTRHRLTACDYGSTTAHVQKNNRGAADVVSGTTKASVGCCGPNEGEPGNCVRRDVNTCLPLRVWGRCLDSRRMDDSQHHNDFRR